MNGTQRLATLNLSSAGVLALTRGNLVLCTSRGHELMKRTDDEIAHTHPMTS